MWKLGNGQKAPAKVFHFDTDKKIQLSDLLDKNLCPNCKYFNWDCNSSWGVCYGHPELGSKVYSKALGTCDKWQEKKGDKQ